MEHELKIEQCYLIHILEGRKQFEVRKNDRDYQAGDTIKYLPNEDQNYDCYQTHPAPLPRYKITYVHQGLGMQEGFVVLLIEKIIYPNVIDCTPGHAIPYKADPPENNYDQIIIQIIDSQPVVSITTKNGATPPQQETIDLAQRVLASVL